MGNLLTICIPTYNRSVAVDWVLKILKNYLDRGLNFDVLVCDNASTDDTKLIVEKWLQSMPSLTYYCQKGNRGSDYNFLTCYKLFKTKYCWLLGDTRHTASLHSMKMPAFGARMLHLIKRRR